MLQRLLEGIVIEIDAALRTLIPPSPRLSQREIPGAHVEESLLTVSEKKQIASLMRVNHAGEICAQALYRGHALAAKTIEIKNKMNNAAREEIDHLAWCEQRLYELKSSPSLLNPIWYLGSLMLGIISGFSGDRISLGFVAETERQVTQHLGHHIQQLPLEDKKTRLLLEQMKEDESHHATLALEAGAAELPTVVKKIMAGVSKLMTHSSYYL